MRIVFLASDNQGGGRVRSFWPAQELRARGHNAWAFHAPARQVKDWSAEDLVVTHRPLDEGALDDLKWLQSQGCTVLVDEDDHLEAIPGNREWKIIPPDRLEEHAQAISEADGLIVSTPRLETVYGPLAKRVWVCRNALPRWVSKIRNHPNDGVVRVGWQGIIRTHLHDLKWLSPAVNDIQGATLSTVGERAAYRRLGWTGRIEAFGYELDGKQLYRKMARWDIGIVPLEDNALNRSKSYLKALEMTSLGLPVVVRNLPEQAHLIEHGVTGYLADTPEEFVGYVNLLIQNPAQRHLMGETARQKAQTLTIENMVGQWEQVVTEMAGVAA